MMRSPLEITQQSVCVCLCDATLEAIILLRDCFPQQQPNAIETAFTTQCSLMLLYAAVAQIESGANDLNIRGHRLDSHTFSQQDTSVTELQQERNRNSVLGKLTNCCFDICISCFILTAQAGGICIPYRAENSLICVGR